VAKLLVIGAGPAGLYSAIKAVLKGFEVDLFEKGQVGENIRCAEGFFDTMKVLKKPSAGVRFSVKEIIVEAKNTYRFDARPLHLWMIDRKEWQMFLAEKARGLGVNLKENTVVHPKDIVELRNSYDYIIDASGAPSVTSRNYGFSTLYKQAAGRTVQYLMQGDFSHIGKCIKVGLIPDFWGYYWVFPKSSKLANVGIGNFNNDGDYKLWDRLAVVLEREGLDGSGYEVLNKVGGICPTKMLNSLKYDNVLLAGDAAGLTSPLHGGGIDMAIISAKKAVEAISTRPDNYGKTLEHSFYKKLKFENLLTKAWRKRNFYEMDQLVQNLEKYKIYKLFTNPQLINDLALRGLEKILLNDN